MAAQVEEQHEQRHTRDSSADDVSDAVSERVERVVPDGDSSMAEEAVSDEQAAAEKVKTSGEGLNIRCWD